MACPLVAGLGYSGNGKNESCKLNSVEVKNSEQECSAASDCEFDLFLMTPET